MDTGFILNRRPFRDNRLLVDLFTKESGRITCIARVAKKRGKIMQGTLEPFRLLTLDWIGKGEVQTLTLAEEKGRYRIPVADLCLALYLNELVLKLVPKYAPAGDVFLAYHRAIHQLANQSASITDCETAILDSLGYVFTELPENFTKQVIHASKEYLFSIENGLSVIDNNDITPLSGSVAHHAVVISGRLLIKLNERSTLESADEKELRRFLDQLINLLLAGKTLKSRKLAFGYEYTGTRL